MALLDLIQTNFDTTVIELEASKRNFQRSIIIRQDANKSGLISLLENDIIEQRTSISNQQSAQGQTMRPTTSDRRYQQ